MNDIIIITARKSRAKPDTLHNYEITFIVPAVQWLAPA